MQGHLQSVALRPRRDVVDEFVHVARKRPVLGSLCCDVVRNRCPLFRVDLVKERLQIRGDAAKRASTDGVQRNFFKHSVLAAIRWKREVGALAVNVLIEVLAFHKSQIRELAALVREPLLQVRKVLVEFLGKTSREFAA